MLTRYPQKWRDETYAPGVHPVVPAPEVFLELSQLIHNRMLSLFDGFHPFIQTHHYGASRISVSARPNWGIG